MQCRAGCGACCIAISISSPMPGHPQGKPADVVCANLTEQLQCAIFDSPLRPAVCGQFEACPSMCGENREQALHNLRVLEAQTLTLEQ